MYKAESIFMRRFEAKQRDEVRQLAKRIYIYGLVLAVKAVTQYVKKYETQIRTNAGDGVFAVIDLLVGVANVLLSIISGNENVEGDWLGEVGTLTSAQINQINAAIAKWNVDSDAPGGG